jgi:hypothetical protein
MTIKNPLLLAEGLNLRYTILDLRFNLSINSNEASSDLTPNPSPSFERLGTDQESGIGFVGKIGIIREKHLMKDRC